MNTSLPPRKAIPSFWNENNKDKVFLHLGENPLPPSEHVLSAICEAAHHANRYPDTNAIALRERIASYVGHGITPQNIIMGNGSDELIDLAITVFARQNKMIATFEPSFFVYNFAAQRHGFGVKSFRRTGDFNLPPIDLLSEQYPLDNISLTFIANPNNPTGTLTKRETLIEYIDQLPGLIVIDECYFEFCNETVVDLINDYDNLIVFRSFSKSFGLSGLRLGYALAKECLIERMERYALTFPVNALAQAAGIAVLEDLSHYQSRISTLIEQREWLKNELENLGLKVIPSHTNFLLVLWNQSDESPAQRLAEKGILVSDQTQNVAVKVPALRIAVGTPEENEQLLSVIKK